MRTRTLTHAHRHSLSLTHTRARASFVIQAKASLGQTLPSPLEEYHASPTPHPPDPAYARFGPREPPKASGGRRTLQHAQGAYGSKPRTVFWGGPQRQTWPYIETLCKSNDRKVSSLKRLWRPHLLCTPRAAIRAHGALIRTTRIQHHHHLTILTRGWGIRSRVPPGSKPRVGNWHMAFPLVGSAA